MDSGNDHAASAPNKLPSAVDRPLAISASQVGKTYAASRKAPPKEALRAIDLFIPRGSIFGLLGPNGAGKSTFINILSGMVLKNTGHVEIWGIDIDKDARAARAAIGVVPQELNMDPFFTPRESLELQAGFYGVPKAERRTDEILELMGLTDKASSYVRQLSGGMKRRLMIGKAMVHRPPILVLDEPTAGVDVELRRNLWTTVRRLNQEGVTIVLTTHYLEEAQELCDEIAIIDNGRVVACEPTAVLLKRLDHKTLIIDPLQPITEIPDGLRAFNPTLTPQGSIVFGFRQGSVRLETLLDQIRASGIEIRDLRTDEPDLEDVFVSLTGKS